MNNEIFETQWMQIKDMIKTRFGNLTDEDIRSINGRYDNLIAKLEQRYGLTRSEAESELHRFLADRFPHFFATDKTYVRPERPDYVVKKEPSGLNWLALAGIPLLLALGFLAYQNSKPHDQTTTTSPQVVREDSSMRSMTPADQNLVSKINSALAADSLVAPDLSHISITASKGVVTINGTVPNAKERDEVLKVVQDVSGGSQINNFLEVRSS